MNNTIKSTELVPKPMPRLCEDASLNLDCLPMVIREVVDELHQVIQAPKDMIVYQLVTSIAAVGQHLFNVESHRNNGNSHPISLMAFILGKSGERKTAVQNKILSPVKKYIKENISKSNAIISDYNRKIKTLNAKYYQLLEKSDLCDEINQLDQDNIEVLKKKIHKLRKNRPEGVDGFFFDGSIQGLWEVFDHERSSVAWVNDEASSIFGGFALSAEQKATTATQLTKLYDGDTVKINYRSNKKTFIDKRLTVIFSAQPDTIKDNLKDEYMSSQGMFPRALFTNPESNIGRRIVHRDKIETPKADCLASVFLELYVTVNRDRGSENSGGNSPSSEFKNIGWSEEARNAAYDAEERLEQEFGPNGRYYADSAFGARVVENATRLAGCFALLDAAVLFFQEKSKQTTGGYSCHLEDFIQNITLEQFKAGLEIANNSFLQWIELRSETSDAVLLRDCDHVYGKLVQYTRNAAKNETENPVAAGHFSEAELHRLSLFRALHGERAAKDPNSIRSRKALTYLKNKVLPELARLGNISISQRPGTIGLTYSVIHEQAVSLNE